MYFVSMIISWNIGEKFTMKWTPFFVVTGSPVTEFYNTRKSIKKRNTKLLKNLAFGDMVRQEVKVRTADVQSLWKCL